MIEEKKEPECYYECGEPLGNEYFVVVKEGKPTRSHRRCHIRAGKSKTNIRMIVK